MSSYHTKFSFLNKNSADKGWLIVHFEADEGEMDSYLSQEQIYTDSYNGAKRLLYGTRWTETALVKITVIKGDGSAFTVAECRDAYRWLTGNPKASWLDLYVGDELQYSFLVTTQDVKQQKLDARTVGLNIYFESVSPWAYSRIQTHMYSLEQGMEASDGVVYSKDSNYALQVEDGIVYSNTGTLGIENGIVYIDNSASLIINNETDDLYTPIYLNTTFTNMNSDYLSIKNITTGEETIIKNMATNEIITLDSGQFITSSVLGKVFGNDFNFIWPRVIPGINEFAISGSGVGNVSFTYRYPIKIGDCAIDVDVYGDNINCGNCPEYPDNDDGIVTWDEIVDKPTTRNEYNLTDVYTMTEVDTKIENINISVDAEVNKDELNELLSSILGM